MSSNQFPTMLAPKKFNTSSIGLATAIELLPANNNPTALGFEVRSSTIKEPESPPARNLLALFEIKIWPVKVLVKAEPPAHSLSYATETVAFKPLTLLLVSPVVRPLFLTA